MHMYVQNFFTATELEPCRRKEEWFDVQYHTEILLVTTSTKYNKFKRFHWTTQLTADLLPVIN